VGEVEFRCLQIVPTTTTEKQSGSNMLLEYMALNALQHLCRLCDPALGFFFFKGFCDVAKVTNHTENNFVKFDYI
jgi:hypothetical protein